MRSRLHACALAVLLALAPSFALAAPPLRGPAALAEAKRLHEEVEDLVTKKGRYDDALPLAERALSLLGANLGYKDLRVAEALRQLAEVHAHLSNFKVAEPLYLRALTTRKE